MMIMKNLILKTKETVLRSLTLTAAASHQAVCATVTIVPLVPLAPLVPKFSIRNLVAPKCSSRGSSLALLLLLHFAFCALSSPAQTNIPVTPPAPFQQATNQSAALAVFNAALNLLPAWDPARSNDFQSAEFTLESAPLWKSMTAAGTTPYNSTEGDYFLTRNLGLGAEMISLGNGSGNNSIDTLNLTVTLRKDLGNVAGYLLLNGGYGFNQHGFEGAFGPGLVYQYQTHLRLFLDTRFELAGTKGSQSGFLTRVGLQIPF